MKIFGPVLCIVRVASLEEAMQLINDHEYGNGACIFTRDGEAATAKKKEPVFDGLLFLPLPER